MAYPERVHIVEVGPRDGLQSEETPIPTGAKVELIDRLSASGLEHIEVTAFVNPAKIPQLADAEEVCKRIQRRPGVVYSALVPNVKGYERATGGAGLRDIAVFTAATDSYNERNIGTTIEGAFERYRDVTERAASDGIRVRGYVSVAFGCPYEGEVPRARVVEVSRRLLDMGCYQISLGDTTGMGNPRQVEDTVGSLLAAGVDATQIALHLHDTRGTGLANALAALQAGVTTFDSSLGGLGGSPYAPGASGNLATDELVYMLQQMGIATGVDLKVIVDAAAGVARALGKALPSRYLKAAGEARA
ncbi:MAG TPA: hydroxymethylglutaryl-CoA lyase [Actinomycetota bacterium]|nr:hydroxymethylglutaryl-CoA lyase [Actinomycetota bacterium]